MLVGAEILHMKKRLKKQWGAGYREFFVEEQGCFEGIEHKDGFLTSQERANIVMHFLQSVRAGQTDTIGGLAFLEGQSIGTSALFQIFDLKSDVGFRMVPQSNYNKPKFS